VSFLFAQVHPANIDQNRNQHQDDNIGQKGITTTDDNIGLLSHVLTQVY
jgi:hypothetical protein